MGDSRELRSYCKRTITQDVTAGNHEIKRRFRHDSGDYQNYLISSVGRRKRGGIKRPSLPERSHTGVEIIYRLRRRCLPRKRIDSRRRKGHSTLVLFHWIRRQQCRTIDNRLWRDNNALPRNVYRASRYRESRVRVTNRVCSFPFAEIRHNVSIWNGIVAGSRKYRLPWSTAQGGETPRAIVTNGREMIKRSCRIKREWARNNRTLILIPARKLRWKVGRTI